MIRTNEIYKEQVEEAKRLNETYQGVKGESYMSQLIVIPDNCLFDYMHTSCIGTLEQMLNLWLFTKINSQNEINAWYLGKLFLNQLLVTDINIYFIKK